MTTKKCPRCPKCNDPLLPGSINCSCGWRAKPAPREHDGWCQYRDGTLACPLPGSAADYLCRYHARGLDPASARRVAEYARIRLQHLLEKGATPRQAITALYYSDAGRHAIERDCTLQPKGELARVNPFMQTIYSYLRRPPPATDDMSPK